MKGVETVTDKVFQLLTAPRSTKNKIRQLEARANALAYTLLPSGIRYDRAKVQTSPDDQLLKVTAKLDETEREIKRLKRRMLRQVEEIREACDHLEKEEEQTVLIMYYVGGAHMDQIADAIGYSVQSAYRIRKEAQIHLDEVAKRKIKVEKNEKNKCDMM